MLSRRTLALAFFLTALSTSIPAAHAQSIPRYTYFANIPFDFSIGTAVMPAGTYEITPLSEHELRLRTTKGHRTALVFIFPTSEAKGASTGQLRFDIYGEQHFLREFSAPNTESRLHATSRLVMSSQERRAAKLLSMQGALPQAGLQETALKVLPLHP